jgi:urease subunit gamma/beta
VHLGPTEEERLLVFQAAELARRTLARGLRLNAPEAIAIACDEMHMAARSGADFEEVLEAGRSSVSPDELMDGVAGLIGEIRLEVLLDEGTRLIVLRGLGSLERTAGRGTPGEAIGAVVSAGGEIRVNDRLESFELDVANTSGHTVRVSSHFPFDSVNPRLAFDREAARGARLDIPAGDVVRFDPGETRTVRLVRVSAEDR